MREDTFTHTEHDAGEYERMATDVPTRAEEDYAPDPWDDGDGLERWEDGPLIDALNQAIATTTTKGTQ